MAGWGGKRPGAGRKKKDRAPEGHFETAEGYLRAVVSGEIAPDAVRVAAAKALIQYERAKQRAPIKSPTAGQLQRKSERDIEKAKIEDFERKADEIRKKWSVK